MNKFRSERWLILLICAIYFVPLNSNELNEICANLGPSERAAALAAGYDIDSICSTISDKEEVRSNNLASAPIKINTRQTISSGGEETINQEITPSGASGELRPFGYDLFAGSPDTFAPASNIPVSPDYLLGPGDSLEVFLYGKDNRSFSLEINSQGYVDFPTIGPIYLSGLSFSEAKDLLLQRIAQQIIGVNASISMGNLRSIQVFLLGESYRPGSYTISSLSSITNALIASGGVTDIASLRNIQLIRDGQIIHKLDLYDLLLKGDITNDKRLMANDVIFIPTSKGTVSIKGSIIRPAIYEIKENTKVKDLIEIAGGFSPRAFKKSSRLRRITDEGFEEVIDLDLTKEKNLNVTLKMGDHLQVDTYIAEDKSSVYILGNIYHPGSFKWKNGLKISDLLKKPSQFLPNTDFKSGLLIKKGNFYKKTQTFIVDLEDVLKNPNSETDYLLEPLDRLEIFGVDTPRPQQLSDLIKVIEQETKFSGFHRLVSIQGPVKSEGVYPLTKDMTVKQLISLAGGLKGDAYTLSAEIIRQNLSNQRGVVRIENVRLSDILSGKESDIKLQPQDTLVLKRVPEYSSLISINLTGEFIFPGRYVVEKGSSLRSVIVRAGGLSEFGDVNASIFSRQSLRENDVKQIESLREEIRDVLAQRTITDLNSGQFSANYLGLYEASLDQLENVEAIGRLVINLEDVISGRSKIEVKDGDILYIPQERQEVAVIGQVYQPTSHIYSKKKTLWDYIDSSGGLNTEANKKAIYIVRSNGEVILPSKLSWLGANKILPGDSIIIPAGTDERRGVILDLITQASTIIYQLSLGAAALDSLRD